MNFWGKNQLSVRTVSLEKGRCNNRIRNKSGTKQCVRWQITSMVSFHLSLLEGFFSWGKKPLRDTLRDAGHGWSHTTPCHRRNSFPLGFGHPFTSCVFCPIMWLIIIKCLGDCIFTILLFAINFAVGLFYFLTYNQVGKSKANYFRST